ncbi:glycosyltransferase family 2 protein [Candidatus Daviesbacteria bacterium]|nr:glycosyltransferase family 2 protein [Candidatus Daviesbacteria bacterium]
MKTKLPTVSIIIPTMNRKDSLLRTLRSISFLKYPQKRYDVVIINNASSDGTSKLVRKNYPKFKLIENSHNVGFAPALNQGIKNSKGQFVFITNDDVIFHKDCLTELINLIQTDKKIGVVGGKMFFQDQPEIMALPGFKVNLWLGYFPYDYRGADQVRETDITTGGCTLIRRSILNKSGMYDDGFFFCGEDYDFCFRVRLAGFKILYCPKAIVWHGFLSSAKATDNFNQLFAHYRGKFKFMLIHASILQILTFLPIQLFFGPFFSYLQSRKKTLLPMIKALIWNIVNLPATFKARGKVSKLRLGYPYV